MIINTSTNLVMAIASVLSSIGAINWGLIGIFKFNLVSYLLGDGSSATKVVYMLVGISGLYSIIFISRILAKPSIETEK